MRHPFFTAFGLVCIGLYVALRLSGTELVPDDEHREVLPPSARYGGSPAFHGASFHGGK